MKSQGVYASPVNAPFLQLRIDAQSGPSGQAPAGTLSYSWGTAAYNETVSSAAGTCLAVSGNHAVIGGYGLRTQNGYVYEGAAIPSPAAHERRVLFFVVDNGPPGTVPFTGPDQIALEQAGSAPPTDCATRSWPDLTLLAEGDIIVHDAPAPPTSKDQCTNGGWRTSAPMFKNQGQCVAFVERGPKP